MDRREFLKKSAVTTLAFSAASCGLMPRKDQRSSANQRKQPNILIFNGDDLGPMLGCYGDRYAHTPNMDQLAATGVRFSTAWVSQASCSPSRSSMYTGLFPHQNGQIGLAHHGYAMHREYPTIVTVLKNAGYRTAVVGKFHIEPKSACPFDVQFTDSEICSKQRDVTRMAEVADQFIGECGDQPFYLMVNWIDPHKPFTDQLNGLPADPVKLVDVATLPHLQLDSPKLRKDTAGYYNCVARLDVGVGMIMDVLKKHGKLEDTVVIVIGDHGPPFTRSKCSCYDTGMRIPMIVNYPAAAQRGIVRNEMVCTVDLLPTICELTGQPAPPDLAGQSFAPLLMGKAVPWRQYMFGEYNSHGRTSFYPRRTVRNERYQLIENLMHGTSNPVHGVDGCSAFNEGLKPQYKDTPVGRAYACYANPPRYELYDLSKDPYELVNLADDPDHQQIRQPLIAQLDQWRKQTNDPFLDPAQVINPAAAD